MNKRNDFICIGAIHSDYILQLKQNYFKNRTNPINQKESIGGVAFNISKMLSFLNQNTQLRSLNCNKIQKKIIKKMGIKFKALNKNIGNRYYSSILDKKGKMIFGLAKMDDYENFNDFKNVETFANKNIILDLNLSSNFINKFVTKNSKKNYICICGTSAHKVYKIKNLLNKIDTIILNKQESFILTNKKTIKDSLKYLISRNKKLNIIITNGQNSVNAYLNKILYISYPISIKVKNENGAGDDLCAVFNFYLSKSFNDLDSLNKGVVAGLLKASGYEGSEKNYLTKIDRVSKSIKYKIIK